MDFDLAVVDPSHRRVLRFEELLRRHRFGLCEGRVVHALLR